MPATTLDHPLPAQRPALALAATALLIGLCCAPAAKSEPYSQRMMLHGAVETTALSGRSGSPHTLAEAKADHAVYGLFSVERRDNPCWVALRTENVNDSSEDEGAIRDFCGAQATSNELGVDYGDSGANGTRVFVSGLRVCMNNDRDRVKGFQIRGKRITSDGQILDLETGEPVSTQIGGSDHGLHTVTMPMDKRANCDGWMRWVDCPYPPQVAIGLVAHFDTGNEPRSLTGLALQCRHIGREYAPR